jgi:hypothetical protein
VYLSFLLFSFLFVFWKASALKGVLYIYIFRFHFNSAGKPLLFLWV